MLHGIVVVYFGCSKVTSLDVLDGLDKRSGYSDAKPAPGIAYDGAQ